MISQYKYNKTYNNIYKNITNFEELLGTNIDFLNGVNNITFNHYGPINQDHKENIPLLIDLTNKGFLTCSGQSPLIEETIMQRSYVEGFIQSTYYCNFLNFLNSKNNIYFIISDYNGNIKYSNFNEDSINLTKYKKNDEWIYCTNLHNEGIRHNYKKLNNIFKDCINFFIVSNEYGGEYIENILLDFNK
jgi:hypothetical protein